jgi:putative ABC transport system substrate-binding protein
MVTRFAGYTVCALLFVVSYPVKAQESKNIPRLGFLAAGAAQDDRDRLAVFREGLRELGYVEAKNILIEYRFADGKLERLPELAAGLARLNVNIIVTAGNEAVQSAKNATQTIPIIMAFSGDPVRAGFVASLAQPGGNITGLSRINIELSAKRLELLNETVPSATRIGVLFNPEGRVPVLALKEAQAAAQKLAADPGSRNASSARHRERVPICRQRPRRSYHDLAAGWVHRLLPNTDRETCGEESPAGDVQ